MPIPFSPDRFSSPPAPHQGSTPKAPAPRGLAWHPLALTAAANLLWAAGCQPDRLPVYPVKGSIFYQGRPATDARVIFHPLGGSDQLQRERPMGTVAADGTFQLTTYDRRDGLPAGKYQISVVWREATTPQATNNPDYDERNEGIPADRLQGRYADPTTSGLSVMIHKDLTMVPPIQLK